MLPGRAGEQEEAVGLRGSGHRELCGRWWGGGPHPGEGGYDKGALTPRELAASQVRLGFAHSTQTLTLVAS